MSINRYYFIPEDHQFISDMVASLRSHTDLILAKLRGEPLLPYQTTLLICTPLGSIPSHMSMVLSDYTGGTFTVGKLYERIQAKTRKSTIYERWFLDVACNVLAVAETLPELEKEALLAVAELSRPGAIEQAADDALEATEEARVNVYGDAY